MERLTIRAKNGSGNVYLDSAAKVCWAGLPEKDRFFCEKCPDLKNRDRRQCGPCMAIDRLAAYEDTGLKPEEVEQLCRAAKTMMFEDTGNFVRHSIANFEALQAYRSIGTVEEITRLSEEVENRFLLWVETHYRISGGRLMELVEAEQKRREGCEYCKGDNPKGCVTVDIPDYEMLDEPTLRWVEAPKFCPICGRDLRGDSHG